MTNQEETFKRIDGKTPAGGQYSIVFFYDKESNPTTKDKAEVINIVEYDEEDNELRNVKLTKNNS